MSIITHKVNGIVIGQRKKDGFINATSMCSAHRKELKEWLRNKETLDLFTVLGSQLGIVSNRENSPVSVREGVSATDYVDRFPGLITVKQGSPNNGGGVWLHPDLAMQLAQWCSAAFALHVSRWVREAVLAESQRKAKQSPWGKIREEGMDTRREFTDAIQDYIARHPQLPEDSKKYLYARATDDTYMVLFGRTAKQLYLDFEVEDRAGLRDKLSKKELQYIQAMEDMAMRLVDANPTMHPCAAVQDAAHRLLIPVSHRRLRSLPV